jgi:nitrite reductase/ring-hydroxylating ferredoxin subunit
VDIRYADAGKWKEQYAWPLDGRIAVARTDELKPNQMKLVHWKGRRIVVGRTENGYVAFDDRCTHRGGPLSGGALIDGTVQCPWHGSQFDVHTGAKKAGPAKEPVACYTLVEEGNMLFLQSNLP